MHNNKKTNDDNNVNDENIMEDEEKRKSNQKHQQKVRLTLCMMIFVRKVEKDNAVANFC
jgi:hypothetical protein